MTTDWGYSNYWINKTIQRNQPSINDPLSQMLEAFNSLGMLTIDMDNILKNFNDSKYYSMLLKEYIFEDIRINEFPDKPSRMKCIFLAPQSVDLKEFAKMMNFGGELKYLEIQPLDDSKVHFANISLLNCDPLDHEVKINNAREYWNGNDEITKDTEVLYEGEFIITQVLTL